MKGVYVLVIRLRQAAEVSVGALGTLRFAKGIYTYVGSAQNNFEKRIERHFRKAKQVFWHVDYLLENPGSEIDAVFFKEAPKAMECIIAEAISQRGEAVVGFGCSDCGCLSHLNRIRSYDFLLGFMRKLEMPKPSTFS